MQILWLPPPLENIFAVRFKPSNNEKRRDAPRMERLHIKTINSYKNTILNYTSLTLLKLSTIISLSIYI
jgi:hypothetical protein